MSRENKRPTGEFSVAVIGLGHVGSLVKERLEAVVNVVGYDAAWDTPYPRDELAACDLAVICVPTPMLAEGGCDTSLVEQAIEAVPVDLIWVRSTVPPGTCDLLAERHGKRICFSPEYIGETNFSDGYDLEEFLIIGGDAQDRLAVIDLVMRAKNVPSRIIQCSNAEAELAKYMENSFLAVKVGFVAEFYELAQKLDLDWFSVREAWLADPRMGRAHSQALPHDLGFGGKCLPKDVAAICAFAREQGSPLEALESTRDANLARRSE